MKPRRVEIEWRDSHAQSERWVDPPDLKRVALATCSTIGYLVREDETLIIVAQSYGLDARGDEVEEWGHPLTIPRIAIISVKDLRR